MDSITKKCSKCRKEKSVSEFHKDVTKNDGCHTFCKACTKQKSKAYRENNLEKLKEKFRIWREENKEKARQFTKTWKDNNKDRIKEYSKEWRKNNAEKVAENFRSWSKKNPGKILEKTRNRRAKSKGNGGVITKEEWECLKVFYGYTCLACRRKEPEIKLTLDHVIPIFFGGINVIDNAQPLCKSCNSSKGTKTIDYRKTFAN